MLTLQRFKIMADSYGANPQRWPEELRREAEMLLNVSTEARALLEEARKLDEAIDAARAAEDAGRWGPGEQSAALARLRSGVEARIASTPHRLSDRRRGFGLATGIGSQWIPSVRLYLLGMAAAGSCAVMVGFLIGSIYVSEPASDSALAMLLQPAPIHILSD